MPQHHWIKSQLGHGESMCQYCKVTNREAAVLGMLNECTSAPPDAAHSPDNPPPGTVGTTLQPYQREAIDFALGYGEGGPARDFLPPGNIMPHVQMIGRGTRTIPHVSGMKTQVVDYTGSRTGRFSAEDPPLSGKPKVGQELPKSDPSLVEQLARRLEPKSEETSRVIDNRHERRRQAKFAKLRAKQAVKLMRAQGIDFVHDKRCIKSRSTPFLSGSACPKPSRMISPSPSSRNSWDDSSFGTDHSQPV